MSRFSSLIDTLLTHRHHEATGRLTFQLGERRWYFYLMSGRLWYAQTKTHRVRRWQRLLKQFCPSAKLDLKVASGSMPKEYALLLAGVQKGQLTVNQARSVVYTQVQEVLFDALHAAGRPDEDAPLASEWQACGEASTKLALFKIETALQAVQGFSQTWQATGLGHYSPNLAPVLVQPYHLRSHVTPETYQTLTDLLRGEQSLWELAAHTGRPITAIAQSLAHFVEQGYVEFQEIPDLSTAELTVPPQALEKPLVACIDDSPLVGQALSRMLEPAGYRVLAITDPLRAPSILLQQRPAVIFLDLMMPTTNGYELCSFLRKTTLFKDIPIVILTGQNGMVDRVRAKMAGATEFMTKPPEVHKVLTLLGELLEAPTEVRSAAPATVDSPPKGGLFQGFMTA